MDRLLRGDVSPDGRCDIKTLANEAGVDRTSFYGARPYTHLRIEFERRLQQLEQSAEHPNPRETRVTRLDHEITALKERLTQATTTIDELTAFRTEALARLAAQHDEITRLRSSAVAISSVTRLPRRASSDNGDI